MNEETNLTTNQKVLGPGRLLQLAREEKNLRPEDIAYEIRLTPSQVRALDEDDYSNMPEETYVRGYLRNYARLVGVPENEILMSFARFTRAKDASSAPSDIPMVSETTHTQNKAGWIIAVFSIVGFIVLSATWVLYPSDNSPQDGSTIDTVANVEEAKLEEIPVGTSNLKLDEIASENKEGTRVEQAPSAKLEDVTPTNEIKSNKVDQALTDGGVLLISYKKDSWTDVRDANGVKLLYRTVKAGEKIALAGKLPISLFFGFAQGVDVKFNGKVVDVSVHTRGVFARFTVGEKVNQ